jgi:hypothetical protein
LLCRDNEIEKGEDSRDLLSAKVDDVDPAEVGTTTGGSKTLRRKNAGVSGGDAPVNDAPTTVRSDAERRLDDVVEVREGGKNRECESPDGVAAASRRMEHAEVVPLNVRTEHGHEAVYIAVVPGREKGVGNGDWIRCHQPTSERRGYVGSAAV